MTTKGTGKIPISLLPTDVIKSLALTPEEQSRWKLEDDQRNLAISENDRKAVNMQKVTEIKYQEAEEQRKEISAQENANREKAKEMALQATQDLADKVQSLSEDLSDLKGEMQQQILGMGNVSPAVQLTSATTYKSLEAEYRIKQRRYDDAKTSYNIAFSDAEHKFYQQICLEQREASEAERSAKLRAVTSSP